MTDPPPSKRRRNEDPVARSPAQPEGTFIYTGQPVEEIPRNITHLQVHPSVRRIEDKAFKNCLQLRRITIPSTVEAIGNEAFGQCVSLFDVSLREGLKSIGRDAFQGCQSLRTISLPPSVERIDEGAFIRCVSLVDVRLHEGLQSIGMYAFALCTSLVEIEIPNGINKIADRCFHSCLSLRTVSMPISVETIDREAFACCKSLVYISLPKRLNCIEYRAFGECDGLSSVVIPQSLHSVGDGAIAGCNSLLCVEFPSNSNIQLGIYCFSYAESLVNVTIPRLTQGHIFAYGRIHESKVACIENRFSNLPIHDRCYRSSVTTREEMVQVLDDSSSNLLDESLLRDAFDMTPFHILASSASLNLEVLQCLLHRYPTIILHYKDCYDYTMTDYLLKHTSPRAVPPLQMVLRQAVIETVSTWHPKGIWGTSLSILVELIPSNSDRDQRRQCVKNFF